MTLVLLASLAVSAYASSPQDAAPRSGPAADCRAARVEAAWTPRPSVEFMAEKRPAGEALAWERFMAGDVKAALEAWNRMGQPRVRCVNVEGLVRTAPSIVIGYLNIAAGELFTAEKFSRSERRLDELPIATRTRLRYDPLPEGAIITPIVRERDLIPVGIQGWGVVAARAVFVQEVRVDVSGMFGRGEVWTPSYRFQANRPRVMLRFVAPAPGWLPGIVGLHGFVESQAFRYPGLGDEVFKQSRQRVGATMSDWITSWLRWEGGAAFDRIAGGPSMALEGRLNARALGDRLAVIFTAGRWSGSGERAAFTNRELVATMRSTTKQDVPVITTLVGVTTVSDPAPLAIWPGATSGDGTALLRAHPLRRRGVINGEAFGRRLVFTTTEYEHPFHSPFGTIGVAGFVDAARSSRGLDPNPSSLFHVDLGAGIRFRTSGTGKVRLDLGYGLRDGRVVASAGFVVPWGRR